MLACSLYGKENVRLKEVNVLNVPWILSWVRESKQQRKLFYISEMKKTPAAFNISAATVYLDCGDVIECYFIIQKFNYIRHNYSHE